MADKPYERLAADLPEQPREDLLNSFEALNVLKESKPDEGAAPHQLYHDRVREAHVRNVVRHVSGLTDRMTVARMAEVSGALRQVGVNRPVDRMIYGQEDDPLLDLYLEAPPRAENRDYYHDFNRIAEAAHAGEVKPAKGRPFQREGERDESARAREGGERGEADRRSNGHRGEEENREWHGQGGEER
jgi:hypothetical protein